MEYMREENCNKNMCKSCIFRTDGKEVKLSVERKNEIQDYLAKGESSHVCHVTNKTCYGGLTFQAKIFFRLNIISEPTVKCLLETANKFLSKNE